MECNIGMTWVITYWLFFGFKWVAIIIFTEKVGQFIKLRVMKGKSSEMKATKSFSIVWWCTLVSYSKSSMSLYLCFDPEWNLAVPRHSGSILKKQKEICDQTDKLWFVVSKEDGSFR